MVKKSSWWNLQDMQDTLIKDTEQKISDGFEEIKSEAQQPLEPVREITATAMKQPVVAHQEPTQNINIPIPMSQHMRLSVIKAHTRQNIKEMVVQAIGLWLDVQEGKTIITNKNN